jgi:hypothetical protein
MKKKKLSLSKKLFLSKAVVADLNKQQQQQLAGGRGTLYYPCVTWDPEWTCESHPRPGNECF